MSAVLDNDCDEKDADMYLFADTKSGKYNYHLRWKKFDNQDFIYEVHPEIEDFKKWLVLMLEPNPDDSTTTYVSYYQAAIGDPIGFIENNSQGNIDGILAKKSIEGFEEVKKVLLQLSPTEYQFIIEGLDKDLAAWKEEIKND